MWLLRRRCGAEGGFGVFKILYHSCLVLSFTLPSGCGPDVSSELLPQHHAWLTPAILPVMMVMDFNPLKLSYKLAWS